CNDRQLLNGAGGTFGNLSISGQTTMLIHDNTLTNTGKAQTHNGDLVGAVIGFNKDVKFYNNVCNKPLDEGNEFDCGIEEWYDMGGWEIYGCTFNGGGNMLDIGFGGAEKGAYAYSFYIHDNFFTASSQ